MVLRAVRYLGKGLPQWRSFPHTPPAGNSPRRGGETWRGNSLNNERSPRLVQNQNVFDLSFVASKATRMDRFHRASYFAVAAVLLGFWVIEVLPLFFESPSWLLQNGVCSGNSTACPNGSVSQYWLFLGELTAAFLGLGIALLLLAMFTARRGPVRLTVSSTGLQFLGRDGKSHAIVWPTGGSKIVILDNRGQLPDRNLFVRSGFFAVVGLQPRIWLTDDATDGILDSARGRGVVVTSSEHLTPRLFGGPTRSVAHEIRASAP